VFGTCAIAANTVQTRSLVVQVDPADPSVLAAQLDAVLADRPIAAVKIGMLATEANARVVVEFLASLRDRPPVILDPVLTASAGTALLDSGALAVLRDELVPLATLSTPNRAEAARLADPLAIDPWLAATRALLVTGGDTPESGRIHDDLWLDGNRARRFEGARVGRRSFHGTGCALSSAIAARLARGEALEPAIDAAIQWVRALLVHADASTAPDYATATLAPCLVPA
jgi:hydroxymethylpyrimidine/phosphomethylpyrimidine kinase